MNFNTPPTIRSSLLKGHTLTALHFTNRATRRLPQAEREQVITSRQITFYAAQAEVKRRERLAARQEEAFAPFLDFADGIQRSAPDPVLEEARLAIQAFIDGDDVQSEADLTNGTTIRFTRKGEEVLVESYPTGEPPEDDAPATLLQLNTDNATLTTIDLDAPRVTSDDLPDMTDEEVEAYEATLPSYRHAIAQDEA